jgi:putative spermidine/putrescine transport system ATP-binding protein
VKLKIQGLSAGYDKDFVIRGLSLSVSQGEFLSLLGPSGCGKTTLMKAVAGILPVQGGRIFLDGEDITGLPIHKRGTVIVFQDMRLFPHMTVEENVAFPLKMQGVSRAERLARARDLLEKVQMDSFGKRRPSELSGGQQQRAALARALAARPRLLLLDEPFSALDENLREDMRNLVLQLQREFHMTVILVTHDREEALSMSDRIALMFSGRLVQTGTPEQVYRRPETRLAADYFGDCVYISGTVSGGRFTGGGLDCPVPFLSREFLSPDALSGSGSGTFPEPGPAAPNGPCQLMLRPGSLDTDRPGGYFLTVEQVSFRGGSFLVSLRADDGALWKKAFPGPVDLVPGTRIQASVRTQDGVLFPIK